MSNLATLTNQSRPLSYLSWLQLYKKNAVSEQVALQEYKEYVHDWHAANTATTTSDSIAELYRNLFKEITLNFTTEEEKRFLSNIDLENEKDLDIAIPFFVKKLKEISQFFVTKRENAKQAKVKYNFNGSTLGLETNIKRTIYSLISNKDFVGQFEITTTVPLLSSVITNMSVFVEGLYDTTTTYFDSSSGFNIIEPLTILDLQQAITDLLATFPIVLQINPNGEVLLTADNQELGVNVPRTNIQDLPYSEFVNAVKSLQNINLAFKQKLYEKYMGTTFFYLSTGTTTANSLSGILFEPTNAYANFLNRYNPTQAAIPNDSNLKTQEEIGSFFTPDKIGLLCFASFTKDYQIDTAHLSAHHIYIFPDPTLYGPGRGNSRADQLSPISHREDTSIIRADLSNQQMCGDIVDDRNHQKFFPYQSREESLDIQASGISRTFDSFDFFNGVKKDIWANSDIYTVPALEIPPFQNRISDLLISDLAIDQWKTDLFGTEFALMKACQTSRQFTSIPAVNRYDTTYTTAVTSISTASIFNRRHTSGQLYVRPPFTPKVGTVLNVLSSIFVKYQANSELIAELTNNIIQFNVVDDILIIQTSSYLLAERYSFDFTLGEYFSSSGRVTLFTNSVSSTGLFSYVTPKQILLGNLVLSSALSGTVASLYPDLYVLDRQTFNLEHVTPLQLSAFVTTPLLSAATLSTSRIDSPVISYSSNTNSYNFTFFVTTSAGSPFLFNYTLKPNKSPWIVISANVYQPVNFVPSNNSGGGGGGGGPAAGPDWSTLDVWNSFNPNTNNGAAGAFSGWTLSGASFSVYIDDANLGGGARNINSGAFFVMYTGPNCNCLATIDMSQWGGSTADADASGIFEITQDGVVVKTITLTNYNRTVSGNTLVVPFSLTAGTDSLILIQGGYNLIGITDGWLVVFLNEALRFKMSAIISNV